MHFLSRQAVHTAIELRSKLVMHPRAILLPTLPRSLRSTLARTSRAQLPRPPRLNSHSRAVTCAVAHHVQKKATKKHAHNRPRKSRPSDRFRTPPSYPSLPDIPWMTKLDGPSGISSTTVSIDVSPEDTLKTLQGKVVAAGAASPEEVNFNGKALTGTLADCGLAEATSVEATVQSK